MRPFGVSLFGSNRRETQSSDLSGVEDDAGSYVNGLPSFGKRYGNVMAPQGCQTPRAQPSSTGIRFPQYHAESNPRFRY